MEIKLSDFKNALNTVRPALASKVIIEQTNCFVFLKNKVMAYNDEISIISPLTSFDFTGVIKSDELYNFLSKIKNETFTLETGDNTVLLKAGRAKVSFATNTEILVPTDHFPSKKADWLELPEQFLKGCSFGVGSASRDMSDPKLTCVHISTNGVIEASDNQRLVTWAFVNDVEIPEMLIPAAALKEVIKLQPTHILKEDGWAHFKCEDGTIISCRLIDETYVETGEIDAFLKKMKKVTLSKTLVQILDKADVFTKEQKNESSIDIVMKNNRMLVKSESSTAKFNESVGYEGDAALTFSIPSYLLRDILKETNECFINKNMLKFEGENWRYVTTILTENED